jgi:hypothetical protein
MSSRKQPAARAGAGGPPAKPEKREGLADKERVTVTPRKREDSGGAAGEGGSPVGRGLAIVPLASPIAGRARPARDTGTDAARRVLAAYLALSPREQHFVRTALGLPEPAPPAVPHVEIGSLETEGTALHALQPLFSAIVVLKGASLHADKEMTAIQNIVNVLADIGMGAPCIPDPRKEVEEAFRYGRTRSRGLNRLFLKVLKLKSGEVRRPHDSSVPSIIPLSMRDFAFYRTGSCKNRDCSMEVTLDTLTGFDLDHRDPLDKKKDPSKCVDDPLESAIQEWAKCDLFCANCHRKRTTDGGHAMLEPRGK